MFAAHVGMIALFISATCRAYMLDGYGFSGITRFEAYCLVMEDKVRVHQTPSAGNPHSSYVGKIIPGGRI